MRQLAGKTALITGGASGIGLGMAEALVSEGMNVVIADIAADRLEAAAAKLERPDHVLTVATDVTDRASIDEAAARAIERFGSIDLVCANAGVGGGGAAVADPSTDGWDRVMEVNLGGVVNTVKAIVPGMRERSTSGQRLGGHVVVTSSVAGVTALPFEHGAYTTSKFAVRGLGESLRLSLAEEGIGVSILCPGLTQTGILDSGGEESVEFESIDGAMDPVEVGYRVVRGVRENAAYIFTHAEFADEFRTLFDELVAAVPTDQVVPADRARFEQARRDLCDHLRHLQALD